MIKLATKFFVKIIASSKLALIGLQKFELDLFQPTSKMTDNESKRTRSTKEMVAFDSWIHDTEARQARGIEAAAHGGYLSERGVETALQHLVRKYKSLHDIVDDLDKDNVREILHDVLTEVYVKSRPKSNGEKFPLK